MILKEEMGLLGQLGLISRYIGFLIIYVVLIDILIVFDILLIVLIIYHLDLIL